MTVRFGNYRLLGYISVFILSGVVLGLSARFASVFLPSIHHDFTIFSLIVPSLTIFILLLTLQWSQPRTEALVLFILGVLWLAMGAWSNDIIGSVQCDSLGDARVPTNKGSMKSSEYCYEMKVIQAFSWACFVLFVCFLVALFALVSQAQQHGRPDIWEEPIRELGWFGEMPGFYNTGSIPIQQHHMQTQYTQQAVGAPMSVNGQNYYQPPGHNLVIMPGMNGAPPVVTSQPV